MKQVYFREQPLIFCVCACFLDSSDTATYPVISLLSVPRTSSTPVSDTSHHSFAMVMCQRLQPWPSHNTHPTGHVRSTSPVTKSMKKRASVPPAPWQKHFVNRDPWPKIVCVASLNANRLGYSWSFPTITCENIDMLRGCTWSWLPPS